MWPLGVGLIHTSVYAGGMARLLILEISAASLITLPSGATYLKPLPDRFRRIPGVVSLTYRSPAAWADSTGSRMSSTAGARLRRERRRGLAAARFQRFLVAMIDVTTHLCVAG